VRAPNPHYQWLLDVADPENLTGDGKSWVLECKPTAKLPKDADPADLARQCLESEGVKADAVVGEMANCRIEFTGFGAADFMHSDTQTEA
jgi:hypothetical protein